MKMTDSRGFSARGRKESEVTAEWGYGPSRSQLADRPVPGKAVWFALPLPSNRPGRTITVLPTPPPSA